MCCHPKFLGLLFTLVAFFVCSIVVLGSLGIYPCSLLCFIMLYSYKVFYCFIMLYSYPSYVLMFVAMLYSLKVLFIVLNDVFFPVRIYLCLILFFPSKLWCRFYVWQFLIQGFDHRLHVSENGKCGLFSKSFDFCSSSCERKNSHKSSHHIRHLLIIGFVWILVDCSRALHQKWRRWQCQVFFGWKEIKDFKGWVKWGS